MFKGYLSMQTSLIMKSTKWSNVLASEVFKATLEGIEGNQEKGDHFIPQKPAVPCFEGHSRPKVMNAALEGEIQECLIVVKATASNFLGFKFALVHLTLRPLH
jgi:hypothetical protein